LTLANYSSTSLIGGVAGSLDSIDGAALQDLDDAIVFTVDTFYFYTLDADSAAAESSPDVISPDANAGNKRWILVASLGVSGVLTLSNAGLHLLDTNASHDLIFKAGSDLTADRILTVTTGDAARTVTLSGNPTLADWFDQAVKTSSAPTFDDLKLYDTNASHTATIHWNEDEATANRTLNLILGGADRTITLSGNITVNGNTTLNDWFDQAVKATSSPTFAALTLTAALTVASGGTGATTLTDHGILVGSGTGPITPLAVGTTGQVLIGATGADPKWLTAMTDGQLVVGATGADPVPTTITPEIFTSNGTFTAKTTKSTIEMWGGGGGGGGGGGTTGGGGGGGGGYLRKTYTTVGGTDYAVTIGAAGSGGAANSAGGAGGASSVGALATCGGGSGGHGGAGTSDGAGGAGGSSPGYPGQAGDTGETSTAVPGVAGATSHAQGGIGGAGGATANAAGSAGTGYGSGGGGGGAGAGSPRTGGAGTAGLVVITSF